MKNHTTLLFAAMFLSSACNEYDLYRPKDEAPAPLPEEEPPPEEEGPEEPPDIHVTPESIDFGGWPQDCPADPVKVTISNEGQGELVVSDIAFVGDGASAFSHNAVSLPTLAFGEYYTFFVDWTPQGTVDYTVDLEVASNDPDEPVVEVPNEGFGAEDVWNEESFYQDFNEVVDVLWVVDNSCSMGEETEQVRSNFAAFIAEFQDLGLDFHMGVITTDMYTAGHQGELQGHTFVTPKTPDLTNTFLGLIDQGSKGSASEKGFEASEAALTDPLLSTTNAGFLRDKAALSVIVLSDENDDSSISSSEFVNFLTGLKKDPDHVRFSAICGDRGTGCMQWDGLDVLQATGGGKYIDAAYATGGFWSSICTQDYSSALTQISLASAGMVVSWVLSEEPSNVGMMEVEVDGKSVPQDSTNGWSYDATENAVTFNGDAIPGADTTVHVRYPIAGECPNE